jgi:hypothetical protein
MPPLSAFEPPSSSTNWTKAKFLSPRSVRFHWDVHVQEIPNPTEEEKLATWMKKSDYADIRNECISVIRCAMNQTSTANIRGLEHKTPEGVYRRQQNKMGAMKAVIEEQDFQSRRGFSDPDWIAAVYGENAQRCLVEAKIRGVRDELEVKEEFQKTGYRGLAVIHSYALTY